MKKLSMLMMCLLLSACSIVGPQERGVRVLSGSAEGVLMLSLPSDKE